MKKNLILMAACLTTFSLSAQLTVVKDAEKAMKSGKGYTEVLSIITPAMQNAETAQLAETYYVPGKAGFKQYDDLLGRKQLGMIKEGDGLTMAVALLGGYDNFVKALALDTVVDAKGKVKTKYSKEIVSTVAGHYNDFTDIAAEFWNTQDYANAYRGWDVFVKLSQNPEKFNIKVHPDSVVGQFMYNRALAAWQTQDFPAAINSLKEAIDINYTKEDVFKYGVGIATDAKDYDALLYFASEGNKRYGKQNTDYINHIINYYLHMDKYDEAISYLDAAIAEQPDNAQYYALEGVIYDNKSKGGTIAADFEKAMELYAKAIQLDETNAIAQWYLGRAYALKAGLLGDAYDGDPTKFMQYKQKELYPLFRQAAEYLEKAYKLDKNNRGEILKVLEVVYYNLNDEEGTESVKQRKMDDDE